MDSHARVLCSDVCTRQSNDVIRYAYLYPAESSRALVPFVIRFLLFKASTSNPPHLPAMSYASVAAHNAPPASQQVFVQTDFHRLGKALTSSTSPIPTPHF